MNSCENQSILTLSEVHIRLSLVIFPASKIRAFSETLSFGEILLSFGGNWLSFIDFLRNSSVFAEKIEIENPEN